MKTFKEFLAEASSGKQKWDKYFASDDTESLVKSDSILYDLDGSETKNIVSKGTLITVLGGEYDTKPVVIVKGGKGRLKLTDIDKPFKVDRTVKINLKPDQLRIFGPIKISEYSKKVKKLIDEHEEIPVEESEYLKALIDLAESPDDEDCQDAAEELYITSGVIDDTALKNTINNDFMEVLGPYLVINEKPEFKAGGVRFPEDGAEPLYDFTMKTDGVITSFSSKRSGGNTNTLKVSEVLKAGEADSKLRLKYARELQLLRIIDTSKVKEAPNLINDWLSKNFPEYKAASPALDNTSIARLEAAVAKFINEKSDLDFKPLVQSAVPDLWYIKAKLTSDGLIKAEPLVSGRDLKSASLRSKSSPGHLSDKLGFAIK